VFGGHGRAFYDDDAMTAVGDRMVPQSIYVEVCGSTVEPDLGLKIEVRQGIPVYTELVLRARADGPEIRDKDLGYVYLNDWLEEIVAACTSSLDSSGHWMTQTIGGAQGRAEARSAAANVRRVRRGRSRLTPEQLEQVAQVYREHFDTRPTQAVAAAFGKSDRTAARYVDEARKAGILPPTSPGQKKA
jgi:hypothetical protein